MKYKHIVFDIDGTLIDTEYAVINSLIKTITEVTILFSALTRIATQHIFAP